MKKLVAELSLAIVIGIGIGILVPTFSIAKVYGAQESTHSLLIQVFGRAGMIYFCDTWAILG